MEANSYVCEICSEKNPPSWIGLEPCIEVNNKLKTEAKNEFEKNFFKLMNNAAFGKLKEK